MRGELYRRWLDDARGLTLEEFVAERRAQVREDRIQRRIAREMGPLLQNASHQQMMQAQMSGMVTGAFRPTGGLGNPFHGLLW